MNKEIGTTLITGFAVLFTVLVAIWMTWADTQDNFREVRGEMSAINTRVGRIEGVLLERGELEPKDILESSSAFSPPPSMDNNNN